MLLKACDLKSHKSDSFNTFEKFFAKFAHIVEPLPLTSQETFHAEILQRVSSRKGLQSNAVYLNMT